jgi:hypothetical protein
VVKKTSARGMAPISRHAFAVVDSRWGIAVLIDANEHRSPKHVRVVVADDSGNHSESDSHPRSGGDCTVAKSSGRALYRSSWNTPFASVKPKNALKKAMRKPLSVRWIVSVFLTLLLVSCVVATTIAARGPLLLLNENQILYLFSTSAQVLAAIYGLTLTGYVFLRNELSREEAEDDTLSEAIDSLKSRYYRTLVFITFLVGVALALSNLAISHEGFGDPVLNAIIVNCGQAAYCVSLLAIAYFIFDVLSPGGIERASIALQDRVDPRGTGGSRGDLSDFIRNYNQIEALLKDAFGLFLQGAEPGTFRRHWSNARMAEMLARAGRIDKELSTRLQQLITLRNSIIHGAHPEVSEDMVQESAFLRDALMAVVNANRKEP